MTTTRWTANVCYVDDGANQVAQARDSQHAAQIVREHNAHAAMVEAINHAVDLFDNRAGDTYDDEGNPTEELNRVVSTMKAALWLSRGEK